MQPDTHNKNTRPCETSWINSAFKVILGWLESLSSSPALNISTDLFSLLLASQSLEKPDFATLYREM